MKILFEVSICDKIDPDDAFTFIKEVIEDLTGECEVKVTKGRLVK